MANEAVSRFGTVAVEVESKRVKWVKAMLRRVGSTLEKDLGPDFGKLRQLKTGRDKKEETRPRMAMITHIAEMAVFVVHSDAQGEHRTGR
jgi:hypothetical protein